MPIKFNDEDNDPVCFGSIWAERDKQKLIVHITNLLCGFYAVVARNIAEDSLDTKKRTLYSNFVKEKLQSSNYIHRDGWLFQMISYICLLKKHATDENCYLAHPHIQPADKGFDNIMLKLKEGVNEIEYILVSEDKATETPKKLFRSQILPEFVAIEENNRTEQLITCTTALLKEAGLKGEELENEIERFFWNPEQYSNTEILRYRANVLSSLDEDYAELFEKFDEHIKGSKSRRRAEMFTVYDMRKWMQELSEEIINYIDTNFHVR